MSEQIPVNPKVLLWARETSGYKVNDVVLKLKRKTVTAETVESWESGTKSPTYAQLETLAYKVYKRPLALFFFPAPPDEETPKEYFRTLPSKEIELLEPHIIYLVRKARVMQENLKELFDGVNPAERKVFADVTIRRSDSIREVAKSAREYLSIGLDTQYDWETDDKALLFWRSLVEQHGIFVFKDAFRDDECSGFCLYDEAFPVIYINNSQPKIRQIFTLFHELAHILFKTGGVDFRHDDYVYAMQGDNRRIEVFCNKFAGEFLVPTQDVQPQLTDQKITDDLLSRLARKYSVSREVILRKCLDLDIITPSYYEAKVMEWGKRKRGSKTEGGDYYNNQGVYLGTGYIKAAFSKFYQGDISRSQLSEYLGMKESLIGTLENRMLSHEDTL